MQWFKGAMVVSSLAMFATAFAAEGCSSKPATGDGGADVKAADSKTDTGKPPGDGSSGSCPSGQPSCEICDGTGYQPAAQPKPIGPHANKCQSTDITNFVNACLGTQSTDTACNTYITAEQKNNATCYGCMVTSNTDANGGALIVVPQVSVSINIPGCVDMALGQVSQENSTSSGSCGDLLNAWYGCDDYACNACRTGEDGGQDTTTFDACLTGADTLACASYKATVGSAAPCNTDASTGPCEPADPNAGFTDQELINFINYFCGQ